MKSCDQKFQNWDLTISTSFFERGTRLISIASASKTWIFASETASKAFKGLSKMLLQSLLSIYKAVFSAHVGGGCRFEPSCSDYAVSCAEKFPAHISIVLIFSRLLKCQPWGPFGFDPVPERTKQK